MSHLLIFQHVDFISLSISDDGIAFLAPSIELSPRFARLNLNDNGVCERGGQFLLQAIRRHLPVFVMDISNIGFPVYPFSALIFVIISTFFFQFVFCELSNNRLPFKLFQMISGVLLTNRQQQVDTTVERLQMEMDGLVQGLEVVKYIYI